MRNLVIIKNIKTGLRIRRNPDFKVNMWKFVIELYYESGRYEVFPLDTYKLVSVTCTPDTQA